jgi:hypothetical protein
MRPEDQLKKKVLDYLATKHIWHFVYTASTTFGLPDILVLFKGVFIGLELKREDKKGIASLLQKEMICSIKKNGGFAAVVDNLEEVVELIECLDNMKTPHYKWHDLGYELDT